MNGSGSLEAIAGELRNLQCRQKELGAAALQEIRHADAELAGMLLEAFGLDDERAGMWLAQPSLLMVATPIEQLATGRRAVVIKVLAGIVHGFGA
ncbi:MAG: hypothetical protein K8F53_07370 [Rhodocyclaceae bacterium]|jgi:hypothetical protein|nr:hypothetical protein [Rhodocyclaceae bacterium]